MCILGMLNYNVKTRQYDTLSLPTAHTRMFIPTKRVKKFPLNK